MGSLKPTPPIRERIPEEKITKAIGDITQSLLSAFEFKSGDVILVGIQTRGAVLVHRLAHAIKKQTGVDIPWGDLDITLYRDDFSTMGVQPIIGETHLDFDLDGKEIVLVDDVLFTGRTVRAAIDQIMDFGRPKKISLVVLVDRGHRELPITADFAAITIATKRGQSVNLHLEEVDGKDEIVVCDPIEG
jgi:pyrimidine operon attenuation protein/uracil phosphoribosyltransferase